MLIGSPAARVREQDRLDEVAATVDLTPDPPTDKPSASLATNSKLAERLVAANPSRTDRNQNATAWLEVRSGAEVAADRDRWLDAIGELAANEVSPAAQATFIAQVKEHRPSPETLVWLAAKVRGSLPPDDRNRVGALRSYFASQGIRFFENDRLPEGHPGYQLERKAFSGELKRILKEGGVVGKRDARLLLAKLQTVIDPKDLFWAQWQIRRRIYDGKLRFEGTHEASGKKDRYETALDALFDDKLNGAVNTKEMTYWAQKSRAEGFEGPATERFIGTIRKSRKSSTALFHAQRMLAEELEQAVNRLTQPARKLRRKADHLEGKLPSLDESDQTERRAEIARLRADADKLEAEALPQAEELRRRAAVITGALKPLLEGKIDRRTLRKEVIARYRAGEIDRSETARMMSAVAVSRTPTEFRAAVMDGTAQAVLAQGWRDLAESWDEMMETFGQALSGDTYDASGNLIETALDRHVRQQLLRQQLESLEKISDTTDEQAERAWLRARRGQGHRKLAQARTVEERVSAQGEQASVEAAQDDVESVRP